MTYGNSNQAGYEYAVKRLEEVPADSPLLQCAGIADGESP